MSQDPHTGEPERTESIHPATDPTLIQPVAPASSGPSTPGAEPAASEPAASEPAASEPAASEPAASEPAASGEQANAEIPQAAGVHQPPPAPGPGAPPPPPPGTPPPGAAWGPPGPGRPRGGGWRRMRTVELVAVGLIGLIVGILIGAGVTALAAHVINRHDAGPFRDRGHGYYQQERPGGRHGGGFRAPGGNGPNGPQGGPGGQNQFPQRPGPTATPSASPS
jgi:hypothetical protein